MRFSRLGLVLSGSLFFSGAAAACGGNETSTFDHPASKTPTPLTADGSIADGGPVLLISDAGTGSLDSTTASAPDVNGPLAVAVSANTIDVSYGQTSPTITATASVNGVAVAASFSIDRGEVGSIGTASGIFTPTGNVGGVVTVTASFAGQSVSTPVTVLVHLVQNGVAPGAAVTDAGSDASDAGGGAVGGNGGVGGEGQGGALDGGVLAALGGVATADPSLGFLYPYDRTIWPRGILAPLLQWTTTQRYDGVYIHISETGFDYRGYFASTATPFVHHPVPQAAWDAIAASNEGDEVTVALTFDAGGVTYGPIVETWRFAQTSLTGTVYYNSYGTNLAHNYCCTYNGGHFGGATLAIKHGATDPVLVAGNDNQCRVCHSVSANGAVLVTSRGESSNDLGASAYDLLNGFAQTQLSPADGRFNWAALSPDGTFLLANNGPIQGGGFGPATGLFNVADGGAVPSSGLPANLEVGSPVFSPDGLHVAFNFYGGSAPDGGAADAKSLAMMDYDPTTSTFSNFQVLYTPPAGYTVWPSFLPTSAGVVFELEMVSNGGWGETRKCPGSATCSQPGTQAKLYWVDTATKNAVELSSLNGEGYLPSDADGGHADDTVYNYEPTVNPVAGGGYAWVVFTSRRLYGNVATIEPYASDPRYFDLSSTPTTKKLWVAAIDLNAPPGSDPSHPAFYLPGQELLAGNSRGYWVVDPCLKSGSSCLTGDQCCGGYCSDVDGGLVCSDQPPACSTEFDKCTQTSDCCGAAQGMECIGGRCATSSPPPPPVR
jgi:hypothetical protein